MAVPVDIADRRAAEVEITARTRFEEPTVEARLELRVNGRPAGQFVAPPTTAGTTRFTVPDAAGLWRRGFNRVEIVSLGVTPVDSSDTRAAGRDRAAARRPAVAGGRSIVCGYEPLG